MKVIAGIELKTTKTGQYETASLTNEQRSAIYQALKPMANDWDLIDSGNPSEDGLLTNLFTHCEKFKDWDGKGGKDMMLEWREEMRSY